MNANAACLDCRINLIPAKQWRALTPQQRPTHTAPHGARGLCQRCYCRHRGRGDVSNYERSTQARAEFVAEFEHIDLAQELSNTARYRLAAPRLGVTVQALERAHQRHRNTLANQETGTAA